MESVYYRYSGGNGGIAINGGIASGASGSTSGNGNAGNGGFAIGPGSQANGANGQKGGFAIGAGSDANGGGVALNDGVSSKGTQMNFSMLYVLQYHDLDRRSNKMKGVGW